MDKLWTKGTASAVPHSPGLMRALAPEIRFLPRSWKHQSCLAKELSSRPEEAWACCPPKGHEKHLGPATTFYETVALSFVIPSEAEGSAVPRSFPENAEIYPQTELSSRPERTRISCHAALETTACAAFSKESRMKFANATNTNRKSGVAEWRDLRFYLKCNPASEV
jgi:hypothetical protein